MTTPSLNIDHVARAMHVIDAALPGNSPEIITALVFTMIERAINAGQSPETIHSQVAKAIAGRAVAEGSKP